MVKIFHFMWFQGFAKVPLPLQETPRLWQALNPGYQVRFWDEESCRELIREHFPHLLDFWEGLGEGEAFNVSIIKKCDYARLLILLVHGGWYFDLDCIPCAPLSRLLEDYGVRHHRTPFFYGPNPTVLDAGEPVRNDFNTYELILTREHEAPAVMGGFSVCNGCLYAQPGSPFLQDMVEAMVAFAKARVLSFAGPHGVTRYLRSHLPEARGKVLVLPPYYFLWQYHDMGPAWERTVCHHINRMDWADLSRKRPWDI